MYFLYICVSKPNHKQLLYTMAVFRASVTSHFMQEACHEHLQMNSALPIGKRINESNLHSSLKEPSVQRAMTCTHEQRAVQTTESLSCVILISFLCGSMRWGYVSFIKTHRNDLLNSESSILQYVCKIKAYDC